MQQSALVASARVHVQEIWEWKQIGLVPCSDSLCMRGWKCFVFCFFLLKKKIKSSNIKLCFGRGLLGRSREVEWEVLQLLVKGGEEEVLNCKDFLFQLLVRSGVREMLAKYRLLKTFCRKSNSTRNSSAFTCTVIILLVLQ